MYSRWEAGEARDQSESKEERSRIDFIVVQCVSGVWSLESGVWSLESGVWSLESGVWSLESGQTSRAYLTLSRFLSLSP